MASVERQVLLAPDSVARAVAARLRDRRARWMLRQPREVRRSYVRAVLNGTDGRREAREQRWMLLQDDAVRLSYVSDVLEAEARRR